MLSSKMINGKIREKGDWLIARIKPKNLFLIAIAVAIFEFVSKVE